MTRDEVARLREYALGLNLAVGGGGAGNALGFIIVCSDGGSYNIWGAGDFAEERAFIDRKAAEKMVERRNETSGLADAILALQEAT